MDSLVTSKNCCYLWYNCHYRTNILKSLTFLEEKTPTEQSGSFPFSDFQNEQKYVLNSIEAMTSEQEKQQNPTLASTSVRRKQKSGDQKIKGPTLSTSTSSFEALDPHDPQLNHLASLMFSKTADWISSELESTSDEYKLIQQMNK